MNNQYENYNIDNNVKEKSFGHKLISTSAKCILIGGFLGATIGFAIPFTTDYVIPKLEMKLNNEDVVVQEDKSNEEEFNKYVADLAAIDEASANTVALIKKVNPSVVCITSVTQSQNWFNQTFESEGSGSGIIFSQDSANVYIATNAHVISGASRVSISVENSDLVSATLVGKDTNADLAVISVAWQDLKAVGVNNVTLAQFGNSSQLQVGESVIAIGNALGGGNTATAGIVSALAKDVDIEGRKLTVIQTDAAINPGNSGGALINSSGQVIGINTAKLAITSVEGIGYSIASDIAKPIIEQLMSTTDTPALGVYITTVSEELANYYGLPTAGVLVQSVIDGGSAAGSDIRTNDIITSFNGQPVFTAEQLTEAVKKCKVGDMVDITLVRNGETKTVAVKLMKSTASF